MQPYYQDEAVTIYHGDCRDVLPTLDIPQTWTFTDPPYNAGKSYGLATDDRRPWDEWCTWLDDRLDVILLPGSEVFAFLSVTAYQQFSCLTRHPPRWTLCWQKPLSMAISDLPFMHHWEPILYWGESRHSQGARFGSDVLRVNTSSNRNGHPTEKPVDLMRLLVAKSPSEALILDPFAGSGTTLRAAKDLGRRAVGVEIEERYCEIAARRMAQAVLPLEPIAFSKP